MWTCVHMTSVEILWCWQSENLMGGKCLVSRSGVGRSLLLRLFGNIGSSWILPVVSWLEPWKLMFKIPSCLMIEPEMMVGNSVHKFPGWIVVVWFQGHVCAVVVALASNSEARLMTLPRDDVEQLEVQVLDDRQEREAWISSRFSNTGNAVRSLSKLFAWALRRALSFVFGIFWPLSQSLKMSGVAWSGDGVSRYPLNPGWDCIVAL